MIIERKVCIKVLHFINIRLLNAKFFKFSYIDHLTNTIQSAKLVRGIILLCRLRFIILRRTMSISYRRQMTTIFMIDICALSRHLSRHLTLSILIIFFINFSHIHVFIRLLLRAIKNIFFRVYLCN